MKKIFNLLTIAAVSVLLHSCHEQEHFEVPMNEDIVLSLSASATRAADTDVESYVDHVDIFIFEDESGAPKSKTHYERRQVNNARQLTLNAKRSTFDKDAKYHVYLIANSYIQESEFSGITEHSELLNKKQEDPMVYLTGLSYENVNVPKYFLMDAIATDGSSNSPVVLNNGNVADNTQLSATLRRAAAKVQVTITAADNVAFKNFASDVSDGGLYYIRNLSYDAYLLDEAKDDEAIEAKVRTTSKGDTEYFAWHPETDSKKVTLTVYAYPNHWSNTSILEHETCIVVNLPMTYTEGSTVMDYPNSWYKIPMTNDQTLRRNNYYEVNITLDRPGASTESTPEVVDPIYYAVEDWTVQDINVGGEDKPAYLMVNHTELEMRNISVDNSTLEFASSSPVIITVKDIYYYNKYGVKTTVNNDSISATTDGGIDGNITVNSPTPWNNTIRYFTLVVTNQENISKEITVEQYPLVYITNIQSYYSYRSDFLSDDGDPTGTATADHYEERGDYTWFAVNYSNGSQSFNAGGNKSSGFFVSKYVSSTYTDGNNKGLSKVYYYTRNNSGTFNDPYNARMYHIHITATSGDYVLGRPKITDGVTDPGPDNARMVSPSFMIASRLGTLTTSKIEVSETGLTQPDPEEYGASVSFWGYISWPDGSDRAGYEAAMENFRKQNQEAINKNYLKVYAEHAKQYVEVYKDPETNKVYHLSDWRLPTEAELKIIYQFQGSENAQADAIDYLLNAGAYFSASGPVDNPKSNMDGTSVRCIRDVYEVAP